MTHEKQIEFFTGVEDLPMHRWQDFNLFLLAEAEAGNGIEGLSSILATAHKHLSERHYDKAGVMLINAMQCVEFTKQKVVPVTLAYAATVARIGEKDVSAMPAEQVVKLLELSQEPYSKIREFVEAFRKKCLGELEVFFPQLARSPIETDFAQHIKKRTALLLQGILGRDTSADLERVDAYLFSLHSPQLLAGSQGAEVTMKKEFDTKCLVLQTHGIDKPEMLSVRKFYSAIEMMKKK